MTIILFILILGVLIFVHELGHFVTAKFFGIRVDEFGMGLPPRAAKLFSRSGTDYTLNWIPFGGFVKIYGEDALEETDASDPDINRSFGAKKWWQQIIVLVAGVTMNFLLAAVLFSFAFMIGAPTAVSGVDDPSQIINPQLTVLEVVSGSPAEKAGIAPGDHILMVESLDKKISGTDLTPDAFVAVVRAMPANTPIHIQIEHAKSHTTGDLLVIPQKGLTGDYPAIGASIDMVGMYHQGFFKAIKNGFLNTWYLTGQTLHAFGKLITDAVHGHGTTKNLTGPVGLVSAVGDAEKVGGVYVIMLAGMISINLAVLNIMPFPALDGGRVVMVIIEAVTRRKIKPVVVQWINTVGFFLLIALMIFITVKDVMKLF